ncbi:MAG: integrase [Hyphomonadaceae bacterium]
MLNYDVFEAFKSAGADDEKARRAAEALARTDGLLSDRFKVDERFMRVEAKLDLHSWILAFNTAMIVAVLWRVFTP